MLLLSYPNFHIGIVISFFLEEADSFLGLADDPDCPAYKPFYYDFLSGDILILEAILNSEPPLPLQVKELISQIPGYSARYIVYQRREDDSGSEQRKKDLIQPRWLPMDACALTIERIKNPTQRPLPLPFIDQMHERFYRGNEYYSFLDVSLPSMPITLSNAPGTFNDVMLSNIHDMVEKTRWKVLMDDFSVIGNSYAKLPSPFKTHMLQSHKDMLRKDEVDKPKSMSYAKLPHPTTDKGLGVVFFLDPQAGFYDVHSGFLKNIPTNDNHLLEKNTPFIFSRLLHSSFPTLKDRHCQGEIARWVLLLQEFDFKLLILKEREPLAADSSCPDWKTSTIANGFESKALPTPMIPRLKIFTGKLKSRWNGPFTITRVFPYGTVELSQANGPNFKVNGHRVKHYFGGNVPHLDCPDCEDSQFCHSSRVSHPQLHLGIRYPNLID
ncbi:hypothetical protein Tco_0543633 [Tanacetum coccineum]